MLPPVGFVTIASAQDRDRDQLKIPQQLQDKDKFQTKDPLHKDQLKDKDMLKEQERTRERERRGNICRSSVLKSPNMKGQNGASGEEAELAARKGEF